MTEVNVTMLIILLVPFLAVVVCWVTLMITMHKTTGELKYWLTPENLIKGVVVIFVVTGVLALGVLKILDGAVIATILSGIIGYTLGMPFVSSKS